jgi:hypothetical protein
VYNNIDENICDKNHASTCLDCYTFNMHDTGGHVKIADWDGSFRCHMTTHMHMKCIMKPEVSLNEKQITELPNQTYDLQI